MNYIPSVNIEIGIDKDFKYIVTPNAKTVVGNIVSNFQSGFHSQTIIGTYGTGKSSFLAALERDLVQGTQSLVKDSGIFGSDVENFEFLKIVGDYSSLNSLLSNRLNVEIQTESKNLFSVLGDYCSKLKKKKTFLFIVIDEFGKVLEHAANNNPEQELYFMQKLAEFANVPTRNVIVLTTLHQNFGAYSRKLTEMQRNEWMKVKGRFREIVFNEPVEQVILLASQQLGTSNKEGDANEKSLEKLLNIAKKSKFVSQSLSLLTIKRLYPLDPLSLTCLTMAIQKYGQNERTLFSFLSAKGKGSFGEFNPSVNSTYNIADIYDYCIYTFFSYLSEANSDSMNWSAIRVAIERSESGLIKEKDISSSVKLVKTIGLLNLFAGSHVSITKDMILEYAQIALGIKNPESILSELEAKKIVRYAAYKSQYILFEGTDIDIEDSILKAASVVPVPQATVDEINEYFDSKIASAVSEYYKKGTPRYFSFVAQNEPSIIVPSGDIDGYVQMIFPLDSETKQKTIEISKDCKEANVFVYYKNMDVIVRHLHEIKKLQYVLKNVIVDDRIAKREVSNLLDFEKMALNDAINETAFSNQGDVMWIYKGIEVPMKSQYDFRKLLSKVSSEVYHSTPMLCNELFNKQKISSAISLARVNLLNALLEHSSEEDLGFDKNTFPPEKTIYYSLLKDTGIHRKDEDGIYSLLPPNNNNISDLWNVCDSFVSSTAERPKKLGELIKLLKAKPFKLKQGLIDFWLPIFILIKQQDFSLYNSEGVYVMNITKEVFELLQKKPNDFSVKAYNVTGVKLEFFKKYSAFLKQKDSVKFTSKNFIRIFKPYLQFYKSLNNYAKTTNKFDNLSTAKFRDVLANAKDPEKTFFEDLPEALGYKGGDVLKDEDFARQYDSLIRNAVQELNKCYDNFIDRIELSVVSQLSLNGQYEDYIIELQNRYKSVKMALLPPKSKTFLDRILSPSETKKEFYEKIGNVVLDKRLDQIKDKEEELFINNLLFLFREIERYISISDSMTSDKDEVYNIELSSSIGISRPSQTYRLSEGQRNKADQIESNILKTLSGEDNLDVCILLRLLNKKLKN